MPCFDAQPSVPGKTLDFQRGKLYGTEIEGNWKKGGFYLWRKRK
jgi:hypothetical protein